jgi:hypothetical protein
MKLVLLLAASLALVSPFSANAEKIIAICKDPQGVVMASPSKGDKPTITEDGFKQATWTFTWDSASPGFGQVVVQSSASAGGRAESSSLPAVKRSVNGPISFVAPYEQGTWLYTLFPQSKTLLTSRHLEGLPGEQPHAGLFYTRCDITVSR